MAVATTTPVDRRPKLETPSRRPYGPRARASSGGTDRSPVDGDGDAHELRSSLRRRRPTSARGGSPTPDPPRQHARRPGPPPPGIVFLTHACVRSSNQQEENQTGPCLPRAIRTVKRRKKGIQRAGRLKRVTPRSQPPSY
jgi:hypothetical protein